MFSLILSTDILDSIVAELNGFMLDEMEFMAGNHQFNMLDSFVDRNLIQFELLVGNLDDSITEII